MQSRARLRKLLCFSENTIGNSTHKKTKFGDDMVAPREKGIAAIEFVIIIPFLLLILFGVVQYSWLLNNYTRVINAAGIGVTFFSTQYDSTTAKADTLAIVQAAVPNLTVAITTRVNGTACLDPDCGPALITGQGQPASVTVTYTIQPLFNMRLQYLPGWPTTYNATISQRVPSGF
jgi:Flp pilus assembly protein TadG